MSGIGQLFLYLGWTLWVYGMLCLYGPRLAGFGHNRARGNLFMGLSESSYVITSAIQHDLPGIIIGSIFAAIFFFLWWIDDDDWGGGGFRRKLRRLARWARQQVRRLKGKIKVPVWVPVPQPM